MARSSIAYRRLWYYRRRNAKPLHRYCMILTMLIILAAVTLYTNRTLSPYVIQITETKARTLVTETINSTISEEFGGKVKYTDLSIIKRDDKNRITSIEVNTVKLNEIAVKIASQMQNKLSAIQEEKVAIPLGALSGIPIFSAEGPDIYIKILPAGKVDVEFVSDFSSVGSNQTR
ncbi:MAG: sporulation protein YunB, partial [Clostridiales bacterium]|nr:sporulation protein YunB [Clostridiales bacterium]